MYDDLTPVMIVAALKNVKEFHIDLIDLTHELVNENGELDEVKVALKRKEIDEAADQAEAYVKSVREAVSRITRFQERSYVVNPNH
ncbi:MAG: hypothetical protein PHN44_00480 [Candidatus Marinimicrobia bacterium]|nr:hypothetical protein [Candidatus Neomarinimicrobiota bacterium]MDD5539068.1 hypothetical protein [Candidatus Neomarinimicrobiota bacterium]